MKKRTFVEAARCVVRSMLSAILIAAFIILISTPGGMEMGDITWTDGVIRAIISMLVIVISLVVMDR